MADPTTAEQLQRARSIFDRYAAAGQGHVFDHFPWTDLGDDGPSVRSFLDCLDGLPVEHLNRFVAAAAEARSRASSSLIRPFDGPVSSVESPASAGDLLRWRALGVSAVAAGSVAAVVLAGGQGTRLGWTGAKGTFPLSLPSGRTPFRLLAERLARLRKLAGGAAVPLYVMTSPSNDAETRRYFRNHVALPPEDVAFFAQDALPCLGEGGTILMEGPLKVALAPDGNGGVYRALRSKGMLDDMGRRGIKHLHFVSVDNVLTRPADPLFLGYCIEKKADVGNKAVWRQDADEKVGVLAVEIDRNDPNIKRPCIVEYSDLSNDMRRRANADGKLVFGAGNICSHYFTYDFIKRAVLPGMDRLYHLAEKQIPVYDPTTGGTKHIPGIKLESFVFDPFRLARSMAVLEVPRWDEFSPVKNAEGDGVADSPNTARRDLSRQAKKWAKAAGAVLVDEANDGLCEIAPEISYAGEGLAGVVFNAGEDLICPFRF